MNGQNIQLCATSDADNSRALCAHSTSAGSVRVAESSTDYAAWLSAVVEEVGTAASDAAIRKQRPSSRQASISVPIDCGRGRGRGVIRPLGAPPPDEAPGSRPPVGLENQLTHPCCTQPPDPASTGHDPPRSGLRAYRRLAERFGMAGL